MPAPTLPNIPDKFKLTPEFKLLVACSWIAPPALEQDQAQKIAALSSGAIDWDAFIVLVRRHGVPSLAYTMLCQHAGERLPGKIRAILKADHIQAAGNSLFQAAELVRLIKLFDGHGIDLIPLKGVFLSHQLYGDMGMRTSCDLDILVKPEHIDLAEQILVAEGYKCSLLGKNLTKKQRAYLKTNFHHLEYGNSSKNICLEVHWRFGSLWLPDQMAAIWNKTRAIEWHGRRIFGLDDDSQLLFLCDHGARHGFFSIKWLSDIARILTSERSQGWKSLLELAESLDMKRTLASSVLLAHWLYGIPLADEFSILIIKDQKAVSISTTIYTQLCLNDAANNSMGKPQGSLKLAWQKLRLRSSLPIRMTLKPKLVAIFDFIDFPLPDKFFWLYYPLRPVSLIWRHYFRKSTGGKT